MILLIIILSLVILFLLRNSLINKRRQNDTPIDIGDIKSAIIQNINEKVIIVDKTLKVIYTNDPKSSDLIAKNDFLIGRLINCYNYCKCGTVCSNNTLCENCQIYKSIINIFQDKKSVKNQTAKLIIDDKSKAGNQYNIKFSAKYIKYLHDEFVIINIHEMTKVTALRTSVEDTIEKFSSIFNNVMVGCAICDKDGNILEINNSYAKYIGLANKDDINRNLNIYNNPCINSEYKEMIRKGVPVFGEVKYDFEKINRYYVNSSSKEDNYYRFIASYIYDENKEIQNIFLVWVDNTLVHNMLRENNMFKNMIKSASSISDIGFCSISLTKRSQLITKEYLYNLGIFSNKYFYNIDDLLKNVHLEDRQEIIDFFHKACNTTVSSIKKNIRVKKGEEYKWVEQYFVQQKFDPSHNDIVVTGVNVDIDAEKNIEAELIKEKERAETSDKLKSAFLANVSHEIRTPLNAIVGFSDLLINTDSNDKNLSTYKNIIEENSNLLLQLIGDILDLSKMEAGTIEFDISDVDLNALFGDLEKVYVLKNKDKKDVEIKFNTNDNDFIFSTDAKRLTQLITNLVTNAMKFTDKGSITFGYEKRKNDIYFYVNDTGCGIPKNKIHEIFQRFVQLNSFKQGTGLGLSICKNIVKSMGGKIGVKSEVGKGSLFWFTLPLDKKS